MLQCELAGVLLVLVLVLVLSPGPLGLASAKPFIFKTEAYLVPPGQIAPLVESASIRSQNVRRGTQGTLKDSQIHSLNSVTCTICKVVVGFVQAALSSGRSDEKIVNDATKLCIFLGEVDERVCVGLINMFKVRKIIVG